MSISREQVEILGRNGMWELNEVVQNIKSRSADYRWLLVLLIYAEFLCAGFAQVALTNGGVQLLLTIFIGSTVALWMLFDSRRRGRPILHIVQFFVVFFWPIALPIYMIATRRFKGVGWTLLHAMGFFVTVALGAVTAELILHGPAPIAPPG